MLYFLLFFSFFSLSSLNARVTFIHVPKCGGTTIHTLLEKFFSVKETYPHRKLIGYLADLKKRDFEDSYNINHEFISGHFPIWFLKEKDPQFSKSFKFTILRFPIDIVISEYKYRVDRGICQKRILDLPANTICKMLCSDPTLEGEELLEDCKKNLSFLDLIIFCENIDDGVQKLFSALGLSLKEEKIGKFNESLCKVTFPPSVLKEIRRRNALDIALYEYAVKNFKNKPIDRYPLHLSFLDSLYEDKEEVLYTFDMPAIQKGWFHRENVGTSSPVYQWIHGEKGSIYFKLKRGIDYQITFRATSLVPSSMPSLTINGTSIPLERLSDEYFSEYRGIIPSTIISNQLTEIIFSHPHTLRFNKVYPHSKDTRLLSMAVNAIHIKPCR